MRAASNGFWPCRTGSVSAQDPQYAAGAGTEAAVRPKPPSLRGKWAMARDVAGTGPVCRCSVRQPAMA